MTQKPKTCTLWAWPDPPQAPPCCHEEGAQSPRCQENKMEKHFFFFKSHFPNRKLGALICTSPPRSLSRHGLLGSLAMGLAAGARSRTTWTRSRGRSGGKAQAGGAPPLSRWPAGATRCRIGGTAARQVVGLDYREKGKRSENKGSVPKRSLLCTRALQPHNPPLGPAHSRTPPYESQQSTRIFLVFPNGGTQDPYALKGLFPGPTFLAEASPMGCPPWGLRPRAARHGLPSPEQPIGPPKHAMHVPLRDPVFGSRGKERKWEEETSFLLCPCKRGRYLV